MADRYKAYTYDSKGRMALSVENTLGQISATMEEQEINWIYGLPLRYTVLGVQGDYRMAYDVWGKNTESTNPIGVTVYNEIGWDIRAGNGTSLTEADNALWHTNCSAKGV